jgi:hypothetical protein
MPQRELEWVLDDKLMVDGGNIGGGKPKTSFAFMCRTPLGS